MAKLDIALVTNMTTPYRAPFYEALVANENVNSLRVYTCVARERDRQWDVKQAQGYTIKKLWGFTFNFKKGPDASRIVHFRFGIFWQLLIHRPSVVVIGDASWTSFLAVLACILFRLRYVVWNEITTSSKISYGLAHKFRLWMYRHACHLIASCTLAKNYLLACDVAVDNISIVNNAVDNDYFLAQKIKKESLRDEFRRQLGVAEGAYCYIYVGQLISRKKVVETVEYVIAQAKLKPCHLLVVGTGPLENALREKAEEFAFPMITFCGYANQDRLCELYIASDCLVLLSDDEPWGMVVNEALLFERPFVASVRVGAAIDLLGVHNDSLIQNGGVVDASNSTLLTPKDMALKFFNALSICQ